MVEIFTAERLARLKPEDRARFRELYDQAKARLEARGRSQDSQRLPANDPAQGRGRERIAQGR